MSKDGVFLVRCSWICRAGLFACSQFLILCLLNVVQFGDGHSSAIPRFCFNGANKGHRFNTTVYKNSHALSKIDCVVQCVYDNCCRSVNYRKSHSFNGSENCELLHAVLPEEPENLNEDKDYDYSIVLQPQKSFNCRCIFTPSYTGTEQRNASIIPYETIGCFKDTSDHAIAMIEGQDSILDGDPRSRVQAIEKCYQATKKRGFQMFSVQDGGRCLTSATAVETFDKYGRSTDCNSTDGKGGTWCSQVYYIIDYVTVGCYKDSGSDRAIPALEGTDGTLDGFYRSRQNAITKCAVAAKRKGYSMFALQAGGHCKGSASAPMTFNKYGKSYACQSDGKGGSWANEVYCING